MRMWMVDPSLLCDKHLLGEHVECHMFSGTIRKKRSISGYIKNNFLELRSLKSRHDHLAEEMVKRGMNHKSFFVDCDVSYLPFEQIKYEIDRSRSFQELMSRCKICNERFQTVEISRSRI